MIHLIIGPMFSGKTTELIRIRQRAIIADKTCAIIKYGEDVRYTTSHISTHNSIHVSADHISTNDSLCDSVQATREKHGEFEYLFVDEIQFYPDAPDVCDELANQGIRVIVCGLQGDSERRPFGCIPALIARADRITHLTAVDARTGEDAPFSQRIQRHPTDTPVKLIGGADIYRAVSRATWFAPL